MKVESLTLRSFRNIRESVFHPDPKLNFLLGANGQGKTSFLEALGFLATLRSFRGSKTPELIRWDSDSAEISCTLTARAGSESVSEDAWRTDLKIHLQTLDPNRQKATKLAEINGKPYRNSTAYLSQRFGQFELGFHAIVFNPSDHDLVRGEPSVRRAYLDRAIAAEDVEYLKTLSRYQKLLAQRNAVLKTEPSPSARELLEGFTEPFAKYAACIDLMRLKWVFRVEKRLNDIMQQIAPKQPEIRLIYLSNWVPNIDNLSMTNNNLGPVYFSGHGALPSLEFLEQSFWKRLATLEAAEWKSGHSLVGPHRDDWAFYLGGQLLRGYGSQGEIRSALLALKLAEIELFQDQTGHRPLFLLDDFSSELDQNRRTFLMQFLLSTDLQVFVTTTEDFSFLEGKRHWVSNGRLITPSDTGGSSEEFI